MFIVTSIDPTAKDGLIKLWILQPKNSPSTTLAT